MNPKTIEKSDISPVLSYDLNKAETDNKSESSSNIESTKNKPWTEKQKSDLIKAIAKFPAGSINRWNKVSEMTGRQASECIQMEKLMKSNFNSAEFSNLNASILNNPKSTIDIKDEPTVSENHTEEPNSNTTNENWSQDQQRSLENALKEFSKDTPNRWDRIAEKVSNKTKVNYFITSI